MTQNSINTKLITLGGALTTSGAFDLTCTLTGATNVTFPTSGTLSTIGSGGRILQYQTTVLTTVFTSSAGTYTNVTGLSVAITPSNVASVIIVFANINVGANTGVINNMMYQIVRDATPIFVGAASGSHAQCTAQTRINNTADMANFTGIYVDSPATTAATTYLLQVQPDTAAAWTVNSSYADANSQLGARTASSITVFEWL